MLQRLRICPAHFVCFFGAAAWPCGMNDVKLLFFTQKLVWPRRRTGAKIRALIETRRRWRQFLLAGKGPARHSLKVPYWAPSQGGYH
ncbi:MAG: hypothetical protein DLM68_02670 [Hyphomicrobiales bacterium]|nr:MAG: hypothetical protein DLM68_02670 [Hyphomicrobiales bacterium]